MPPTTLYEELTNDSSSGNFTTFAAAKSDANNLAHTSRFLIITTAGNATVITEKGETVSVALPVGRADLRISRLKATGLTADGVVCY